MSAKLSAAVIAFGRHLRAKHEFAFADAKARDAVRAGEVVGITDKSRLRNAFRAVYCSTPGEVARFDAAFDAFFSGSSGTAQPDLPPRRALREPVDDPAGIPNAQRRAATDGLSDAAIAWQHLRARASLAAARREPPTIASAGFDAMLAAADRLIAAQRLGWERRWKPARRGRRFDVRRTLRTSMQTGGDPVELHRLGPPRRNPRFVVLIDGSRSMTERAGPALQFAHALLRRSRRAHAFVFSTALRDVTRTLRRRDAAGRPLVDLDDAWGGGTRIGAALRAFVTEHGRLLDNDTLVLIASDGVDAGDLHVLDRALQLLRARTAGIVWLHPDAASPDFRPVSGGLRTARKYVRALAPLRDAPDVVALSRTTLKRATPRAVSSLLHH